MTQTHSITFTRLDRDTTHQAPLSEYNRTRISYDHELNHLIQIGDAVYRYDEALPPHITLEGREKLWTEAYILLKQQPEGRFTFEAK